jgi:diguanylate cyclase (GGDEF)-like protein/PAS domain S-box-containing protein
MVSLVGQHKLLDAVLRLSRDVIVVRDAQGLLVYCSPAIEAALGYRPAELVGTPERNLVHPGDVESRDRAVAALLTTTEPQPAGELRLRHRDGTWHWFETIDTNCVDDVDVGGIVTSARDVTERKAVEDTLTQLSLHDTLTGLPNRTLLMDHLTLALARTARQRTTLAVLFCDLDNFKTINDSLGHRVGDLVLLEVARRLHQTLRATDTVARTGGDEFIAVCDSLSGLDEATVLAQRVRDDVESPMAVDGTDIVISVSIGIVTVDGEAATNTEPMVLLRNADAAMYKAKERGRARWEVFDESLVELATQRLELEPELRRALVRHEFALHYQPIVRLTDGVTVGAEALLRWHHPTRGTLLPNEFLGLAEDNGLIVPIGAWVVREACEQAMRWREDDDTPAWISVNLSARQIAEPGIGDTVADALTISGLPGDALWLELTETALLRAGHSAAVAVAAIQALGVHLGMDDFGTGYASLTNLQRLPIDFLKIDRSFVANLTRDGHGGDNAIVEAITQLGATLDLTTVAEGIETQEEIDVLRACGVPYGQGYLIAKPSPPSNAKQPQGRRIGTGSAS